MLFEAFRLVFSTRVTVKMDDDLRSIFASGRCKRRTPIFVLGSTGVSSVQFMNVSLLELLSILAGD